MNRGASTREPGSGGLIGPPSWAVRANSREPGCATARSALRVGLRRGPRPVTSVVTPAKSPGGSGRRATLRRLVPATGATYHASEMLKTGCEQVRLIEDWSEVVVRCSERRAGPHPGRPKLANTPSCYVSSRF